MLSTLAAETLRLPVGFEAAFYLRSLIHEVLSVTVPIEAFVDNKSVVEVVHSTKMVDDKRLRLDIAALIGESLSIGDLHALTWCPGEQQLAEWTQNC